MSKSRDEIAKKYRFGLLLSYITVGYNVIEGIISVIIGTATGSVALVGFGLDSFIESLSGSVMVWRLSKHGKISHEEEERVEEKAANLVGVTFLILAAYVLYEAVKSLLESEPATPSLFGIVIAVLSLIVMPGLAYLKNKTGKEIGSHSLVADSKQTIICVLMSVALFIGLAANYLFGIWWLDPVAGLFFVVILIKEGYSAIKYKDLC
ncbi:MAG: cation transporter [Candidatus Saccharimonadales bacterium]